MEVNVIIELFMYCVRRCHYIIINITKFCVWGGGIDVAFGWVRYISHLGQELGCPSMEWVLLEVRVACGGRGANGDNKGKEDSWGRVVTMLLNVAI
jgi:hypothetical protein